MARAAVPGLDSGPAMDEAAAPSPAAPRASATAASRPGLARVYPPVVGARAELRQQLHTQHRVRVIALISVVVIMLGVLPLYLMIRATGQDPVFTSLDALQLPAWAQEGKTDTSSGSGWCLIDCRFRERDATSQRPVDETSRVYQDALRSAGWQPWKVERCPDGDVSGSHYSCWRRDEYTLDLWVREPICKAEARREPDAQDPPASPAAEAGAPADCDGSAVTIKVRYRIDDERGRGPAPADDPDKVGETPDVVFTPDPILPSPPS